MKRTAGTFMVKPAQGQTGGVYLFLGFDIMCSNIPGIVYLLLLLNFQAELPGCFYV